MVCVAAERIWWGVVRAVAVKKVEGFAAAERSLCG
jgi:hypothetical protein